MKNIKITQIADHAREKVDVISFFGNKIKVFQDMILSTILMVQKYKTLNIFGARELNICIQGLDSIFQDLKNIQTIISQKKINTDDILSRLQAVNNELSQIFRSFGTTKITDLVSICFGFDFFTELETNPKAQLIKTFVHPIGYKVMEWKNRSSDHTKKLARNRIVEDFMIVETADTLDCFDLARTSKNFQTKVYGIKIALQNNKEKKTLIISGIVDDIILQCTNHQFIDTRISSLYAARPKDPDFHTQSFDKFIKTLTIKELLIYSNEELYQRYIGYINQTNLIKQKTIAQVIKEFINGDLYSQRTTLIQLLMHNNNPEFQYLAYLLYDLLSNDSNGTIDTAEQTLLFDSLPWQIKKNFREAMKTTINYTKNLSDFNSNKIPIEQQICLLKADDNVKEKAMIKLKEVKAKSEDSGTKARQYLEGLLKIPFGIYRNEPILCIIKELRSTFKNLLQLLKKDEFQYDSKYDGDITGVEIYNYVTELRDIYITEQNLKQVNKLVEIMTSGNRHALIANVCLLNSCIKKNRIKKHICHSGKKNAYMREAIKMFLLSQKDNTSLIEEIQNRHSNIHNLSTYWEIITHIDSIKQKWHNINHNMKKIEGVLDVAIHGHQNAKRQIERIIGQWINGEQKGYCFGFEGPPGVGKTSLAKKGLSLCLQDNDNISRPFAFIAIGGSCNGSTLNGHNYTYVGSTWGRIIDILMEKKCMNPIIFIDELDKVSQTEHGRDIVSILTHLTDPAQNEEFQDKYFSGINIDMSKALIIFSYNDASTIDPILLDRIHRIKFKQLTIEDKIIIVKKYILPELYQNAGLKSVIKFSDDVIKYIIEKYTQEAGVRKLKESLFEIISEINLKILKNETDAVKLPFNVTKTAVKNIFLKDKHKIRYKKIHLQPEIGIINGLWANSLGMGGICPIECNWFPSKTFLDLKLTGMQGNVMKESMNVAKTLAWKLTPHSKQQQLLTKFEKEHLWAGIHIHCPEGATPKDGPSAGTAITIAIFSLLNSKKIKNNIAITGEINLQGKPTAIGGLDLKILGGIKAGIKEFIYPKENKYDFKKFMDKYRDNTCTTGILFHKVQSIKDVLDLVFV